MKRWIAVFLSAMMVLSLAATASAETDAAGSDAGMNGSKRNAGAIGGIVGPRQVIYKAGSYRYGPSIIINEDKSVDMWTCSPGTGGAWDFIRYRHSADGGRTWSDDIVALEPTPGGRDALAVCDPGVIKFGGYYYLAYTSTEDIRGTDNDIYVARGKSPTGPWEKWNGSGWGGAPQPFIVFDDPYTDTYGAGEPSLVVKGSTLYVYYTWMTKDESGNHVHQTRVSTGNITDKNWPANLTYQGVAIHRNAGNSEDSTDHKYVPALGKFIAVGTAQRFSLGSYVNLYESSDGITYTLSSMISDDNLQPMLHNIGISGNIHGHFNWGDDNFISYASGRIWGQWDTHLNPIQLVPTNEPPNAPTGLTAEPYDGRLELDWSGAFAAASYTVKRSEQPGGPYDVIATGVPGTRYTDTGLENGKTYFYVVTGVNANGEGAPSAELAAVPNVQNNVALGKTVTASESLELAPDWSVTKLTDGITTSIPGANGYTSHAHASPDLTANPIWLQIDLGEMTTIDRVKLYPRSNTLSADSGAPNFPRDFTIEVSADGVSFITVKTVTGQSHIFWQPPAYTFEPVEARYVRLHVTSVGPPAPDEPANHRLQLAEMEVYEAVPSAGE